jgi:hypothetical protein
VVFTRKSVRKKECEKERKSVSDMEKKLKKYPSIFVYLESNHPEIAELVETLALQNNFVPRRGGGITFLVPDSEYVKKIQEIASSDNPEAATDMIQCLLIPLLLETVQDWRDNSDDIPTLLAGKRLEVKSVGERGVVLKNDSVITPNEVFKPFTRSGTAERANMAVWNLRGNVSVVDTANKQKRRAGPRVPKTRNNAADDMSIRSFVDEVIKRELSSMRGKNPVRSVKMTVLCNYVRYLVQHQSEEHLEYFKLVCDPLAAGGIEAAFYLVFCCRDALGVDGVRRVGLNDTSTLVKILGDSSVDLFASVDKPLNILKESLGYPADADLVELIGGFADSVSPKTIPALLSLYDTWVGALQGYAGTRLKAVSGLKLLIDEFKHYVSLMWLAFRESYDTRTSAYKEFLRTLDRFGVPVIINNPAQSTIAQLGRLYKKSPKEITQEHMNYITDFLGEDGAFRSERQELKSDQNSLRFQPPELEYANDDMELSSSTKTELRNYMAKHGGKLPDDLLK